MSNSPSITALQLITNTLQICGYLPKNKTPNALDAQMAFDQLVYLMDSWKLERMLDVGSQTLSCVITPNTSEITIGPSDSLPLPMIICDPRPSVIINAFWQSGTQDVPIKQIQDTELWRSYRLNTVSASYPTYFWYNSTFPVSKIELYPAVNQQLTFTIGTQVLPTIPGSLGDTISLPPAWISALQWNLASLLIVPLALPDSNLNARIDALAISATERIKRQRRRPSPGAIVDANLLNGRYSSGRGTRGTWNANADTYGGIV